MKQVSPHVYIDPDRGGCTVGAVQTPEGVVLIDTPKQPTRAVRWREQIRDLGEVRYLINTEHHIDHVFGNFFFPGIVVAHQETKRLFWEDSVLGPNPLKDPPAYVPTVDPNGIDLIADYRAREPEIAFDRHLTLSVGGMNIEAFQVSGHVPIASAVYLPAERVLFAGDNIFHETMTWYHESVPFEWLETIDHFKQMDVEVVIPGHGGATEPDVFDEMRSVVADAISEVEAAIKSGMSREQAMERISFVERQPVPEEFRTIAPKLQKLFVGRIYEQIRARRGGT